MGVLSGDVNGIIPSLASLQVDTKPASSRVILQHLPIELIARILGYCSCHDRIKLKHVCRQVYKASQLIPQKNMSHCLIDLFHGNLRVITTPFITEYPAIAEHILTTARSNDYLSFCADNLLEPVQCGRYLILLSIWSSMNLLETPPHEYEICKGKVIEAITNCARSSMVRVLPHEILVYLTPHLNTLDRFECAMIYRNTSLAYDFLQSHCDFIDPGDINMLWSMLSIFRNFPTSTLALLFYPTTDTDVQSRLRYKKYVSLYKKLDLESEIPGKSTADSFRTVMYKGLKTKDMSLEMWQVQLISWFFFASDVTVLDMLLSHPAVDPIRWNHLALRLCVHHYHKSAMFRLIQDKRVDPSVFHDAAIVKAVAIGDVNMVRLLLRDPRVNPSTDQNAPLKEAAANGNLEMVKLLLSDPRVDPSLNSQDILTRAIQSDQVEILRLLTENEKVDPSADDNAVLKSAMDWGYTNAFKFLIKHPRVDPSSNENELLFFALSSGNKSIVQALLQDPRVDPSVKDNQAFITSVSWLQIDIVTSLLRDPRVDPSARNNKALGIIYSKITEIVPKEGTHRSPKPIKRSSPAIKVGKLLLSDPRVKQKIREKHPELEDYGLRGTVFEDCI